MFYCAPFSRDGIEVATDSFGGTWRAWNAKTGAELWSTACPAGCSGMEVHTNLVIMAGQVFADAPDGVARVLAAADGAIVEHYPGRWTIVSDDIAVHAESAGGATAVSLPDLSPVWSVPDGTFYYDWWDDRDSGAPGDLAIDAFGNWLALATPVSATAPGADCGNAGEGWPGRWNPWSSRRTMVCSTGAVWNTDAATGLAASVLSGQNLFGVGSSTQFQRADVESDQVVAALPRDSNGIMEECAWSISTGKLQWCTPLPLLPAPVGPYGTNNLPDVVLAHLDGGRVLIWGSGIESEGARTHRERVIALDRNTGQVEWVWRNQTESLGAACVPETSGPGYLYIQEAARLVAIDPAILAE